MSCLVLKGIFDFFSEKCGIKVQRHILLPPQKLVRDKKIMPKPAKTAKNCTKIRKITEIELATDGILSLHKEMSSPNIGSGQSQPRQLLSSCLFFSFRAKQLSCL